MKAILFTIITLTALQGVVWSADCTSDKITISVDQIKDLKTGNNLPSTFKDGDTYTVACKYPSTQVFTNDVRGQYGVDQGAIDGFSDGSQAGSVVVKCTSGSFVPDIFTAVSTWCAVGCSPIPSDTSQHWAATYPSKSLSVVKSAAPIVPDIDATIKVGCKSGYAPEMYQLGQFSTRCLSSGYSPTLSNMVKCTAGCSDITAHVANARVVAEKSAIEGAPPFNVGSVATIECSKGYEIKGSSQVTCTSEQKWCPSVPVCVGNSAGRTQHIENTLILSLLLVTVILLVPA